MTSPENPHNPKQNGEVSDDYAGWLNEAQLEHPEPQEQMTPEEPPFEPTPENHLPAPETQPLERNPLLFMGGMGHDVDRNEGIMDYFRSLGRPTLPSMPNPDIANAPRGYRVVSVNHDEPRIMSRPFSYLQVAKPDVVLISSLQQEARADELIAHIEREGKGPATLIAQSADAQNAVIAAYKQPDIVDKLVLMFPSGMVKKQKRTEYTRQGFRGVLERGERAGKPVIMPETHFEGTDHPASVLERFLLLQDKKRLLKDSGGYTMAASGTSAYNGELLHGLRHENHAPGVAMVLGLKDKMMKAERILESLVAGDDVDYILFTNGGHGMKGDKAVAAEALKLTDKLEELRAERQAAQANGEEFALGPLRDRLLFMDDVPGKERDRIREIAGSVPETSAAPIHALLPRNRPIQ